MESERRPPLAQALKAAMAARGYGPELTAREAGLDPSHLYKILRGEVPNPTIATLEKLARTLDAPGLLDYRIRPTPEDLESQIAELRQDFDQLQRLVLERLDEDDRAFG